MELGEQANVGTKYVLCDINIFCFNINVNSDFSDKSTFQFVR
jgi:hypothetical protein